MYVDSLRLYQFRNFPELSLSFSPRLNLIVGKNGQGKTNLIEALNLLSSMRSFRTGQLRDLVQRGAEEMSAFLLLRQAQADVELGMAVTQASRRTFLNGNAVPAADFVSKLCCVTFSPTDLMLVKGAPDGRRKFIDRHLVDLSPVIMRDLLDYSRALKSKSRILKGNCVTSAMLAPWNQLMAGAAARITRGRRWFLERLEERANEIYGQFAKGDGNLHLSLRSTVAGAGQAADEGEILRKLDEHAEREIAAAACLIGPHRDDVVIRLGELPAKAFASQGQSRSIVLSIKLAVIALVEEARGEQPVLLLDDVDSELDETRRDALFDMVLSSATQVFITGTDRHLAMRCGAQESLLLLLQDGRVEVVEP